MKPKVSRADAQKRATRGFQVLVLNQCITQLRKVKEYQKDGKFSLDEFLRQEKFLSVWKNKTPKEMGNKAKIYAFYSRTYNYALGIPHELIEKVLGGWNDANGKWHRVKPSEVIDALVKKGWLADPKNTRHGSKFRKNEDGSYSKKCWWNNKYLIERKIWFTLLEKDKYMDFNDYPRDPEGYVQRALKIITDHYAKFKGEAKPEVPVQPVAKGWREVVGKLWAHNIEDLIHEIETGRGGWEALDSMKQTLKLSEKVAEEIEREAWQRVKEWKEKKMLQMTQMKQVAKETPEKKQFTEEEIKMVRVVRDRLKNGEITEAQARYVWKTIGVPDFRAERQIQMIREEKDAQALKKLNEVAEAPAPNNPDEKKFVEEFAKQEVAPKKEKKPEPPKVLNDEQLDEFLSEMKQWEERK